MQVGTQEMQWQTLKKAEQTIDLEGKPVYKSWRKI
jgi:hypothetical protein